MKGFMVTCLRKNVIALGISFALLGSGALPALAKDYVQRVAGTDRFETAAAIQAELLPQAKAVFLVTGKDFPDALCAGPAAAASNGAILLTAGDVLPAATQRAIERMKPSAIYAIGGERAVPQAAFLQAQRLAPQAKAERVSGADRYETSAQISNVFFASKAGPLVKRYLASGTSFPDALSGGALAGRDKAPLLLVPDDPAHPIVSLGAGGETIVLGGPLAVSEKVAQTAGATKRFAGTSRYGTSKAILDHAYPGAKQAIYASALNFPDALAAVPAAAKRGIPLYLTGPESTPLPINLPGFVVGGPAAVQDWAWTKAPQPKPQPKPAADPGQKPAVKQVSDQELAEQIEAAIHEGINARRVLEGAAPLERNPQMDRKARAWSQKMLATGNFEHSHNDMEVGIRTLHYPSLAENIFYAMGEPRDGKGVGDLFVKGWINSPGHYRNLRDPEFDLTGIGVAVQGQTYYATQTFAQSVD